MSSVNERIKEVRKYLELTQTEFSHQIGLSQSNLGQIEIGKSNPTINTIHKIISKFHIDAHWLLLGEGEMIKYNSDMLGAVVQNGKININGNNTIHHNNVQEAENEIALLRKELDMLKEKVKSIEKDKEFLQEIIRKKRD